MGRWIIVGFVMLAGVVFVLTRPAERADDGPRAGSEQSADAGEQEAVEPERTPAAHTPDIATPADDDRRYEFAELDSADSSDGDAVDAEASPWTQSQGGFDAPILDPEAIKLLENPPDPTPPPNWDEIRAERFQYPDHIEDLIAGRAESKHKEPIDDFMRENPPGGHRWTELEAAFVEAERMQAKPESNDPSDHPAEP